MNKAVTTPFDDALRARTVPSRGKVCIVTGELAGPDFNGGIGTTNRGLAFVLRGLGFEVDVLYTRVNDGKPFSYRGAFADHVDDYRNHGVNLSCIVHAGRWNDWQAKSFHAMQHLLRQRYDLALFDDTHGNAYYPLLARRTGNPNLRATTIAVTTHSATQWIADLNQIPVRTFEDLRLIEMERRSIELADAVKAPSAYILEKYRSYGWSIPANSVVLPNFISVEHSKAPSSKRARVNEIVFFGRLERRKGLWVFCRALDQIKYKLVGTTVTFLGKATFEDGRSTAERLIKHSASWPFPIRLLDDFDREQALSYLKGGDRFAVIASPEDNSPSAILECLQEGIPFVACSGSGGEELIHARSRSACLIEPEAGKLCAKLLDVLEHGAVPGLLAFNEDELRASFGKWIDSLLKPSAKPVAIAEKSKEPPKPILVIVVPPELGVESVTDELIRTVEMYRDRVEIEVLTDATKELRGRLASHGGSRTINVNGLDDFEKVAGSLKYRESTVVGLCQITQIIPASWIERAHQCFSTYKDVSALTGMVAVNKDTPTEIQEPYFSITDERKDVGRYLMGNASALFPLLQETNSGFAVMRSGLMPVVSNISPLDSQYGRLKRMEDWIHEILLTLHINGKSFELVPDELVEQPVQEAPFEVFGLAHIMRPLAKTLFGYEPGTDQSLLAKLAIDVGLERELSRANSNYLELIAEKLGKEPLKEGRNATREQNIGEMASLAHANGQIALAVALSAMAAFGRKTASAPDLRDYVNVEAESISLLDLIAANKFKRLNLDYDYSFQVSNDVREIKLHANSVDKGMAALIFPVINLSKADHFTCTIGAAEGANPIRFKLELTSANGSHRWSGEKIVVGGGESFWELSYPASLRTRCKLLISIEMADPENPSLNAFGRWINPRFVRHM